MRKFLFAISVAALVVLGLAGASVGIASGKGGDSKDKGLQNLEQKVTSVTAAGFTTDTFSGSKKVGTSQAVSFPTGPDSATEVAGIEHLAKGDLMFLGTGDVNGPSPVETLAIIGGTGAYKAARGTVTVRQGPNIADFFNDFHVTN